MRTHFGKNNRFTLDMEDDVWTLVDNWSDDIIPSKYIITGTNRLGTLIQLVNFIEQVSDDKDKLLTIFLQKVTALEGVTNGS